MVALYFGILVFQPSVIFLITKRIFVVFNTIIRKGIKEEKLDGKF